MRIDVEIDDCYLKRNIWIFAGMEPVARRHQGGAWEIKAEQCSRCGSCCEAIREDHPLGTTTGCKYLCRTAPDEQMCGLHIFRPYGCAIADGHRMAIDACSVQWKKLT